MKKILLLLTCTALLTNFAFAAPPRKAIIGALVKPAAGGMRIDSIINGSTLAAMHLQKGDIIQSINGIAIVTGADYSKAVSNIRTGDKLVVKFLRAGQTREEMGSGIMRPYEHSDIADVNYDWVPFRGGSLRAITRVPKGKTNAPAILLIPGYGCGSIENYMSSYNGKIINGWLNAGYAVVTIEKSGLGDSYHCVPCSEADLQTDIESYDAGYQYMSQLSYVDKERLYIFGHSLGGIIAPEVAKRHAPKGVIVFGTTFRPWSEFLLEMQRVQKPLLEGKSYIETEDFLRGIQKVYYEFFVLKKSREELMANPEYKPYVLGDMELKDGSNDMWGRTWKFWPQIDSLNLAKSWQSLSCPVLVLHGETDYESCSIAEPKLITAAVNAAHPGNASMLVIPQLDHFMMKSKSYEEARDNFNSQQYNKGNFNYSIVTETVNWLNAN